MNKNIIKEVYDSYCTKFTAYGESLPNGQKFKTYKHSYRNNIPTSEGMHVFIYVGQMNPKQKSGSNTFVQFSTEIVFDLITVSKGQRTRQQDNSQGNLKTAESVAGNLALDLLFNSLNAIYIYSNIDVLFPYGQVQISAFPRVEPFFPDSDTAPENAVVGYRITLEPELVWEPIGAEGTPLEEIAVNLEGENPSESVIEYENT